MDAIILAGGLGTRLRSVLPNTPKPLAPIHGTPFLDLVLQQLHKTGLVDLAILAIGYKGEQIRHHYAKIKAPLPLAFSTEDTPLGTGGALKRALLLAQSEHVLVLNGDSYFACDFLGLVKSHQESLLTLACLQLADASRYGQVIFKPETGQVTAFHEKSTTPQSGWINGGIYVVRRDLFNYLPLSTSFSLEKEVFPLILQTRKMYAFPGQGLFIDIGTPESLAQAQLRLCNFWTLK